MIKNGSSVLNLPPGKLLPTWIPLIMNETNHTPRLFDFAFTDGIVSSNSSGISQEICHPKLK